MRLSARRANDSRRPLLATGMVGGNGGVDILQIYFYVYTAIKRTVSHKFIALFKQLFKVLSIDLFGTILC